MSETIDLRVSDPAVWEYVCKLQRSRATGRLLTVRCGKCRTKLGEAAQTEHGPGFAAWWREWEQPAHEVHIDGRKLSPRETIRHVTGDAEEIEGDWRADVRRGYFAPLAIPLDLPQEYVPLVVRCKPSHGAAVLNRIDVLNALNNHRMNALNVNVHPGQFEILPQQTDGLASTTSTARLVKRIGAGESWTPDSFDAWLSEMERDTP